MNPIKLRRFARLVVTVLSVVPLWTTGAHAQEPPEVVGVRVESESLGQGADGTVTAVGVQVAPEHRDLLGERVAVELTLSRDGEVLDHASTVVPLALDGSLMLYREWPVGAARLSVRLAALDGSAVGAWSSDVVVTESSDRFEPSPDAPPDARALAAEPAHVGGVRFLKPDKTGGIGALQLELEAPDAVVRVEFAINGTPELVRNRPPWTVSVPLGQIQRRTTVRATAWDGAGRLVGEDAVVLNAGSGSLGVQILLAPESTITQGRRGVTVAVTGAQELAEVTLSLDDATVARWTECPCVVEIDVERLESASVLAASAAAVGGARGDAVVPLQEGMFFDEVDVELVQLSVVVIDEGCSGRRAGAGCVHGARGRPGGGAGWLWHDCRAAAVPGVGRGSLGLHGGAYRVGSRGGGGLCRGALARRRCGHACDVRVGAGGARQLDWKH